LKNRSIKKEKTPPQALLFVVVYLFYIFYSFRPSYFIDNQLLIKASVADMGASVANLGLCVAVLGVCVAVLGVNVAQLGISVANLGENAWFYQYYSYFCYGFTGYAPILSQICYT
jgi:hypothetical protein